MASVIGAGAMVITLLLILAVRLSDRIEKIARGGKPKAFPTFANFFTTAFGQAGQYSEETLKLRSKLRWLLFIILVLCVLFVFAVTLLLPSGTG